MPVALNRNKNRGKFSNTWQLAFNVCMFWGVKRPFIWGVNHLLSTYLYHYKLPRIKDVTLLKIYISYSFRPINMLGRFEVYTVEWRD